MLHRTDIRKLLIEIRKIFTCIDGEQNFSAEDKVLLKEFFLNEFISPRASRMLKERFPKELTDFDPDTQRYLRRSARLISQSHATEPSDQKPVARLLHLEDTLSAAELATRLRMSVKTIYSYVQRGIIPHRRIESNVLFLESEIAEWLETKTFRRKPAEQDHDTPKTVENAAETESVSVP